MPTSVPVPAALPLLLSALGSVGLFGRRKATAG
ncbi:MAG: PEP-CTERM sorting domain-containing protein [Gammaproteobacteria bacterium]